MSKINIWSVNAALFIVLAMGNSAVWAHGVGTGITQFGEGFSHPWLGADHVLVMFVAGLLATPSSNRPLWQYPAVFWLAMGVGLLWPTSLQFAELGLLVSLLLIGSVFCFRTSLRPRIAWPWLALAGFCHGSLHIAEITADANRLMVIAGLMSASALIQGIGFVSGYLLREKSSLLRTTGLACIFIATVFD